MRHEVAERPPEIGYGVVALLRFDRSESVMERQVRGYGMDYRKNRAKYSESGWGVQISSRGRIGGKKFLRLY